MFEFSPRNTRFETHLSAPEWHRKNRKKQQTYQNAVSACRGDAACPT